MRADASNAPEAGRPRGAGVHATAVAIGGRALLIRGASGAGKSTLALALVAASGPRRRIELVGDDRVLLARRSDGQIVARAHPRTAGFVECRGLGLVAVAWRDQAPVAGCVEIAGGRTPAAVLVEADRAAARLLDDLPVLRIEGGNDRLRDCVLGWWEALAGAADPSQEPAKRRDGDADRVKLQLVSSKHSTY